MAEITRTIVNFGVIELPQSFRECQSLSIYCQVERQDDNASLNVKRPNAQSFYGYAQGIENGYVVWEKAISFQNEEIYFWQNVVGPVVTAIDCATKSILDTIDSLATALGATPGPPFSGEVRVERAHTQRVRFKLFGKTTLYVRAVNRAVPESCSTDIIWFDRQAPSVSTSNPRIPAPPPSVPINIADPLGYDVPDLPYDGVNDGGETYTPNRPVCTGCSIKVEHERPGEPRFPGGPPAVDPFAVFSFPAELCPISVTKTPDDGGASFPKDGDYTIRDKNGNIISQSTSFVFNPFTIEVDNGGCL